MSGTSVKRFYLNTHDQVVQNPEFYSKTSTVVVFNCWLIAVYFGAITSYLIDLQLFFFLFFFISRSRVFSKIDMTSNAVEKVTRNEKYEYSNWGRNSSSFFEERYESEYRSSPSMLKDVEKIKYDYVYQVEKRGKNGILEMDRIIHRIPSRPLLELYRPPSPRYLLPASPILKRRWIP